MSANIAGEGRWVDSRTWAWQLSRPLQPGERCIFSAKSGYTSPTGETFSGKSRFELQGAVTHTVVAGRLQYKHGDLRVQRGAGRYLHRT